MTTTTALTPGTFSVVENAGYIGERNAGTGFKRYAEAIAWMDDRYTRQEIEDLHVDIALVDRDGHHTYDFC